MPRGLQSILYTVDPADTRVYTKEGWPKVFSFFGYPEVRVPVKNQGSRETCAQHAGVTTLEYHVRLHIFKMKLCGNLESERMWEWPLSVDQAIRDMKEGVPEVQFLEYLKKIGISTEEEYKAKKGQAPRRFFLDGSAGVELRPGMHEEDRYTLIDKIYSDGPLLGVMKSTPDLFMDHNCVVLGEKGNFRQNFGHNERGEFVAKWHAVSLIGWAAHGKLVHFQNSISEKFGYDGAFAGTALTPIENIHAAYTFKLKVKNFPPAPAPAYFQGERQPPLSADTPKIEESPACASSESLSENILHINPNIEESPACASSESLSETILHINPRTG